MQLSQSPKHLSDLENTDNERLKALLFIAIMSQLFNYLRFISQYGNGNIFLSPYSLIWLLFVSIRFGLVKKSTGIQWFKYMKGLEI